MSLPDRPSRWDELPDEILLQILYYLEPRHIKDLQLVSRRLQKFCLDDELWKRHAFLNSTWYEWLRRRRSLFQAYLESNADPYPDDSQVEMPNKVGQDAQTDQAYESGTLGVTASQHHRTLQDMANWDPIFPGERVSWYDEYIQRHAQPTINWLQTPRTYDGDCHSIDARGMAIYNPYDGYDGLGTMLAISPLDDGSVCLWDIKGTRGKQGGIIGRSKKDILFIDGPNAQNASRSKMIDSGVTDCVSVNHDGHRAFFAVQSHLIEVDLHQLKVVSRESFEWSITTLSSVHNGVPLTVGTSLGIHLHDFRARAAHHKDSIERLDGQQWDETDLFKAIFDPNPLPPYASLSQPTPINILHLPLSDTQDLVSNDIYVSGRFSNILHYDRRYFPSMVGSIHSGGQIHSMAALPHPFSSVNTEVRRRSEFTAEEVATTKNGEGHTLIAGGGYKNKGSLELYGLGSAAGYTLQNATLKNRQTAAASSILSVINYGTKIAFSDGSGEIKIFERDASTECRRFRIGQEATDEAYRESSLFVSDSEGDLARKIMSTRSKQGTDRPNNDNILFWTGEKLGMVSFTKSELFTARDFETMSEEEEFDEAERRLYTRRMRHALDRQAEDVRIVRDLGVDSSMGPG